MPSSYGGGGRADAESAWPCPPHEVRRFRVNCKATYVAMYVHNFIQSSTAADQTPDDQELMHNTVAETTTHKKTTMNKIKVNIAAESASDDKTADTTADKTADVAQSAHTLAKMQCKRNKKSSDGADKDVQKVEVVDGPNSDSSGTTLVLGEAPKKKTRPANWGSGGTFMGRRPPKDPEKRALFEQKRADWKAQQEKKKAQKDDD